MCMDEVPGLRRTAFRAHLSRLKKPEADTREHVITGPLARCSTALVRPHSIGALTADYTSRIGSLYDGVSGFEGALLLLNRGSNKAQSISLWRGTADFEAAAATPAYRENMAALGSHFLAAPQLEVWEHAGCCKRPARPRWRLSADRPTAAAAGRSSPSGRTVRARRMCGCCSNVSPFSSSGHPPPSRYLSPCTPHGRTTAPPRRCTAALLPTGPSVPV